MKAALLLRCSTDNQDYKRQEEDLQVLSQELGFGIIPSDRIFGEYITGKDKVLTKERISIAKLKSSCEEGKIDVVLISEISRLSRDVLSGLTWIEWFNQNKIPIYFKDKNEWTMDIHTHKVNMEFCEKCIEYFKGAREYLRSMKVQMTSGKRSRARNNQYFTSRPAFGYKRKGGNRREANTLLIDESQAPILKEAFHKYLEEGATLQSVTLYIKGKYGFVVSRGTLCLWLRRRGYTGKLEMKICKNPLEEDVSEREMESFILDIPQIIDIETFDKVQEKLDKNRILVDTTRKYEYMFKKLIKCPECGYFYSPYMQIEKKGALWHCISNSSTNTGCTNRISLSDNNLNTMIWFLVKNELIAISSLNKKQREEKIKVEQDKIDNLEDELINISNNVDPIDKRLKKAYLAYEDEVISLIEYKERRHVLEKEKDELIQRIHILNDKISTCKSNIKRYKKTDYSEEYFKDIEADKKKRKAIIHEYIKVIYPFRGDGGGTKKYFLIEVCTIEGVYSILYMSHSQKRIAYYIHSEFAVWQNGKSPIDIYDRGDYFVVKNASMIMQTNELEAFVSFKDMVTICDNNNWTIRY